MLYRYQTGLTALLLIVAQVTSATTLKTTDSTTTSTLTDLGCVILTTVPDAIKIKPNTKSSDPYNTYTGCGSMTLVCSFHAQLSVRAIGNGAVSAKWDATVRPSLLGIGTTKVGICVTAKELTILENVQASSTLKVAEVVVTIIPR